MLKTNNLRTIPGLTRRSEDFCFHPDDKEQPLGIVERERPLEFKRPHSSNREIALAARWLPRGGFPMTSTTSYPMDAAIFPASELAGVTGVTEVTELTELVLGCEEGLVERFAPLARRQSVTLDISRVRRIDAAGISALLSLYASAREAGHRFTLANPSPRVAEILALVGLERILLSRPEAWKSHSELCFESPAA